MTILHLALGASLLSTFLLALSKWRDRHDWLKGYIAGQEAGRAFALSTPVERKRPEFKLLRFNKGETQQ